MCVCARVCKREIELDCLVYLVERILEVINFLCGL